MINLNLLHDVILASLPVEMINKRRSMGDALRCDAQAILAHADKHNVYAQVLRGLRFLLDDFDGTLHRQSKLISLGNDAYLKACTLIPREVSESGDFVHIKGISTIHHYYHDDMSAKHLGDMDLLGEKHNCEILYHKLLAEGFVVPDEANFSYEFNRTYRQHLPLLKKGRLFLELHFRLNYSLDDAYVNVHAILDHKKMIDYGIYRGWIPDEIDSFIILCCHMYHEEMYNLEYSIKHLVEIYNALCCVEISEVIYRQKKYHRVEPIAYALHKADEVFQALFNEPLIPDGITNLGIADQDMIASFEDIRTHRLLTNKSIGRWPTEMNYVSRLLIDHVASCRVYRNYFEKCVTDYVLEETWRQALIGINQEYIPYPGGWSKIEVIE